MRDVRGKIGSSGGHAGGREPLGKSRCWGRKAGEGIWPQAKAAARRAAACRPSTVLSNAATPQIMQQYTPPEVSGPPISPSWPHHCPPVRTANRRGTAGNTTIYVCPALKVHIAFACKLPILERLCILRWHSESHVYCGHFQIYPNATKRLTALTCLGGWPFRCPSGAAGRWV